MPPHSRVNTRCFPLWNSARNSLVVEWDRVRYPVHWPFDVQTNRTRETCFTDTCVQRLWCTDSGVVGRYTVDFINRLVGKNVMLEFYWLSNPDLQGAYVLAQPEREELTETKELMTWTSMFGPGTILVIGNVLYYYTWLWTDFDGNRCGLPRLNAMYFSSYTPDTPLKNLWKHILLAYNILGYKGPYAWGSFFSPIYPVGELSVTVSVDYYLNKPGWAIDSVIMLMGQSAVRDLMVHVDPKKVPSAMSTSRETHSAPGFACKAERHIGAPLCYKVPSGGRFTWSRKPVTLLDIQFVPFSQVQLDSFRLPSQLWLHRAKTYSNDGFSVLSTFGLGAIIAFHDGLFYGVETRYDRSCRSHRNLVLVCRNVTRDMAEVRVSAPLGCAHKFRYPRAYHFGEVSYSATAIKWVGPYLGRLQLFLADSFSQEEYYQAGEGAMLAPQTDLVVAENESLLIPGMKPAPASRDHKIVEALRTYRLLFNSTPDSYQKATYISLIVGGIIALVMTTQLFERFESKEGR